MPGPVVVVVGIGLLVLVDGEWAPDKTPMTWVDRAWIGATSHAIALDFSHCCWRNELCEMPVQPYRMTFLGTHTLRRKAQFNVPDEVLGTDTHLTGENAPRTGSARSGGSSWQVHLSMHVGCQSDTEPRLTDQGTAMADPHRKHHKGPKKDHHNGQKKGQKKGQKGHHGEQSVDGKSRFVTGAVPEVAAEAGPEAVPEAVTEAAAPALVAADAAAEAGSETVPEAVPEAVTEAVPALVAAEAAPEAVPSETVAMYRQPLRSDPSPAATKQPVYKSVWFWLIGED